MPKIIKRNPNLIKAAARLHQSGEIPADTYVVDLDTISSNAAKVHNEAKKYDIECYFCVKQIGRNPLVSQTIMNSGIKKAMAMNIEEVKNLHRHGVPIGHVGHFGQIPTSEIRYVLEKVQPEVITLFSVEKAKQISKVASELGITQDILLRILDDARLERLATAGGFTEEEAIDAAREIQQLENVRITGVTTYPGFSFGVFNKSHHISDNFKAMTRTARRMEKELGINIKQINGPGGNSVENMELAAQNGVTHVEPGHSITGTLGYFAFLTEAAEVPAVVYVTEISHFYAGFALAYGDSYMTTVTIGSLRNDQMHEYLYACIGSDPDTLLGSLVPAQPQQWWHEDLDWFVYCSLIPDKKSRAKVGDTVVFGYPPQIYRTPKGRVAIVEGIQRNKPRLIGIFDRSGILIEREDDGPAGYNGSKTKEMMNSLQIDRPPQGLPQS